MTGCGRAVIASDTPAGCPGPLSGTANYLIIAVRSDTPTPGKISLGALKVSTGERRGSSHRFVGHMSSNTRTLAGHPSPPRNRWTC
jgi:hypothetical protein